MPYRPSDLRYTPARRSALLVLTALTAALLQACGSAPPARPPAPRAPEPVPPPPAEPVAPAPEAPARPVPPPAAAPAPPARVVSPPEREQQWLQSWFEGTPVRIEVPDETQLAIDVPREFCFDAGSADVRPALAAVLDKLAQSLRRHPRARLQLVAAPADEGAGDAALARRRANEVRSVLRMRGVTEARLGNPTVTTAAAVQLRVLFVAPAP